MHRQNPPMSQIDIDHLKQWIGRSESASELLATGPARALAATLGRERRIAGSGLTDKGLTDTGLAEPGLADGGVSDGGLADGDALPPLWHWIYFWTPTPASGLGPDGHARKGGFLPPVPLPRRMWAGGRLRFDAPLRLGELADKTSTIGEVSVKQGSAGPLAFVTVAHTISQHGRICVHEEHDIVYRDPARAGGVSGGSGGSSSSVASGAASKPAPTDAHWSQTVEPGPVLLFRYSALTFNGHRIHYDRPYATEVEGYPGLIVHGPLVATMLVELLQRELPDRALQAFSFRALSPLFDTEGFSLHGKLSDDGHVAHLWAANARGELAMQAEARLG